MTDAGSSRAVVGWPAGTKAEANAFTTNLYEHLREVRPQWRVLEASPAELLVRPASWHVHWPEDFASRRRGRRTARLLVVLATLLVARLRGNGLTWTVHNVVPHEPVGPFRLRAFYGALSRLVTTVVHLSDAAQQDFARQHTTLFRSASHTVIRHGVYTVSAPIVDRTAGETPVVLCIGQVRAYKNLRAAAALANSSRHAWTLHVAGAPVDADVAAELAQQESARVRLDLRQLDEDEFTTTVDDADAILIADADARNSGVVMYALSRHRRVIVPDTASMRELQALVGEEWVAILPALSDDAMAGALAWLTRAPLDPPRLGEFAWKEIALQYAVVLEGRAPGLGRTRRRPHAS